MRVLTVLLFLLLAVTVPPAAEAQSLADFTRRPQVTGVSMSESGRFVTSAHPDKAETGSILRVYDVDGQTHWHLPFEGLQIQGVVWKGDARMIVQLVKRDIPVTGVRRSDPRHGMHIDMMRSMAMNPDGGDAVVLFKDERRLMRRSAAQPVESLLLHDPVHVVMSAFDGSTVSLYKVNVLTGEAERLERGVREPRLTFGWMADTKGHAWLRFDMDMRSGRMRVMGRPVGTEDWNHLASYDQIEGRSLDFVPVSVSENGQSFYAASRQNGDRVALYELSLANAQVLRKVFEAPGVDIGGEPINLSPEDFVLRNAYTGALNGVRFAVDQPAVHYLNENWARAQELADDAFPGQENLIVAHARNFSRIVVHTRGPAQADTWHMIDTRDGSVSLFGESYPRLTRAKLSRTQVVTYPSRDGTTIRAYLTLPPGGGTNLPLVVVPHGGPEARDMLVFDPLFVQSLAASGYAVIQPQFRGSGGFGKAFADAGRRRWATSVLDDVAGAASYAVGKGIADARRVCVFGWSFGGYAALASASMRPEQYACAIGGAGLYDATEWLSMYSKNPFGEAGYLYWSGQIGDLARDPKGVAALSPINHVGAIRIPVLLITGDKDDVVPPRQTALMAEKLEKANVEGGVVILEGEGHSIAYSASRQKMMEAVLGFLQAHIGR